MVVLLTGGSGFLGSRIKEQLIKEGHTVLAPRSYEMDLMSLDSILNYMRRNRQIDAIIHSAAYYGGLGINVHQPANLWYINSIMGLNVWEAAACTHITQVMSVGSACAYPGSLKGDFKEDDLEAGPCHSSVEGYGTTKRIHLVCQHVYRDQYDMVGAQPILTNLYGEGDDYTQYRSHVVAALIAKFYKAFKRNEPTVSCWGDGSPIREFLYVVDAAEAIVKCLDYPDLGPVNIGTGIGTSIKELVEILVEVVGFRGEVQWDTSMPGGASRKVLAVEKAATKLEWKAKTSLHRGIAKTVHWYRANWDWLQHVE